MALGELQRALGGARAWCTLEEWLEIWPSEAKDLREPGLEFRTAKRQWHRLQFALRSIGLDLWTETPQRGHGVRLHVASPELVALVELEEREALRVLELAEARREGREPEVLDQDPVPERVARDYEARPLSWCSRRYGRSPKVLRKILKAQGREIRPTGRRPVERAMKPANVAHELGALERGEKGVRAAARSLECDPATVRRLLDRSGLEREKSGIKSPHPERRAPPRRPRPTLLAKAIARASDPIERRRPSRVERIALLVADSGGSVRDVAWVLRASRTTAQRFLDRHGRKRGA